MIVTATELKANLGKYLDNAGEQDILISKNSKIVARLTKPIASSSLDKLVGILNEENENYTRDRLREERLEDRYL
ncbi:MAG: type II toxin-antitoxin system prevent-host-death family antitoxin [Tissierellia bacterium]|nr:type II toxin-antitoxin system prevent-host-death family antitoxin [Tissierellia bacterium]